MNILLEELYKIDLHIEKFHDRKIFLNTENYQINGISQSGKTTLVKNYLLGLKKSSYLYINCDDIRIDIEELNSNLNNFCNLNNIEIIVLDNYHFRINIPLLKQVIITSVEHLKISNLKSIQLYPLDYEEFLAYEDRFDASALNHFFQLGGMPAMHNIEVDERNLYIQKVLKCNLSDLEFDIITLCAKIISQKVSPFNIYERLKQYRKVSKDKLYSSFENLIKTTYLHQLSKFNYPKATKKIYLCDTSLKPALSRDKNFGRLFENMIFLELLKSKKICYYDDNIDFYLPNNEEILLCMPFGNERALFKKVEKIEAFIFSYQIKQITVITMNYEGNISHPLSKVEMIPFDIWAIGE